MNVTVPVFARACLMSLALALMVGVVGPARAAMCGGGTSPGAADLAGTAAEARALIDWHTSMMVFALTCDRLFPDAELVADYNAMSLRHADYLRWSEAELAAQEKMGERDLHALRTARANDLALNASRTGERAYCAAGIRAFVDARSLGHRHLRGLVLDRARQSLAASCGESRPSPTSW